VQEGMPGLESRHLE